MNFKKLSLFCLSLLAAVFIQAADSNGRFFLKLNGQLVCAENVEANFAKWFNLPPLTEWREVSRGIDITGMERIEFRQYVGGVEVEHSQVLLHVKDGMVRSANGTVMEALRTPAKVRRHTTPANAAAGEMFLVNTSDGYRYGYKVLSPAAQEWIYYDCETHAVMKRVPVRRDADAPVGVPATVVGNGYFCGEVEIDVTQADGTTYLFDQKRNMHTLNGAYFKTYSQLIAEGKLYDYYPQGDLPDDPRQASKSELQDWAMLMLSMADNNQLDHYGDYIHDFSTYIERPEGEYSSNIVSTITITKATRLDAAGELVPIDMSDENAPTLSVGIVYGADATTLDGLSNGIIDVYDMNLSRLAQGFDCEEVGDVIPREGATVVFSLNEPHDDGSIVGEILAIVPIVPDASGCATFDNERIAGTINYVPSGDPVVDIHWGMARTLDFFDEVYGRKSYDGDGSPIYNLVYMPIDNTECVLAMSNCNAAAMATQSPFPMVFGLGGIGGVSMKPVVELSVMAHEFTHIVTEMTARLEYVGESGALNESFSDIMGITVKKYVQNVDNWYIGGDGMIVGLSNLRDMANPKNNLDGLKPAPDTYGGDRWLDPTNLAKDYGGVHTNSSVQNKWYALLTDGGKGTNDNDYDYNVAGIGIEKARQIAYVTLTSYATRQTDYKAISEASLEATEVLYGENSTEFNNVVDAWKAVGVIDPDEFTGIHDLTQKKTPQSHGIYDLQGHHLDNLPSQQGIYIVDGKKVVVQ